MTLAESVVRGILEKKGEEIVCLDLRPMENAVTDFFIICEANSNIQVEAIADSVEEVVKKELKQKPYRSQGRENATWVLIDYISVIVHVFERETRYFYNLESLWADAAEVKFQKAKKAAVHG
ncbi:MAG: ribosome silencing factor [Bacteroidetes bacterium]|nr:ribosome silencing factor [Bacteroidota bacterium]